MGLLITTLADNSELEIHVFGPDEGGDPIVEALRLGVHHWHQVSLTRDPFGMEKFCPTQGKRSGVTVMKAKYKAVGGEGGRARGTRTLVPYALT